MNLLNIFENTQSVGFENLRALLAAGDQGHDAVLDLGGEPVTLDRFETRFMCAQYRAYLKAGRQQEFIDACKNGNLEQVQLILQQNISDICTLDEIEDLGPTRRASLLDRYGSVSAIKKATPEDIAKTPGIGERLAEAIATHLSEKSVAIDMETGEIQDA